MKYEAHYKYGSNGINYSQQFATWKETARFLKEALDNGFIITKLRRV